MSQHAPSPPRRPTVKCLPAMVIPGRSPESLRSPAKPGFACHVSGGRRDARLSDGQARQSPKCRGPGCAEQQGRATRGWPWALSIFLAERVSVPSPRRRTALIPRRSWVRTAATRPGCSEPGDGLTRMGSPPPRSSRPVRNQAPDTRADRRTRQVGPPAGDAMLGAARKSALTIRSLLEGAARGHN